MRKSPLPKPKSQPELQPFSHHLLELRRRVYVYLLTLAGASVIGYYLRHQLIVLITRPLNQQLFYTSPAGGFDFLVKLCLFFGAIVSLPVFVYQLISFLSPAIPALSRGTILKITLSSLCLVGLGLLFGFGVALPASLSFLNRYSGDSLTALISSDAYFTFVLHYLFGFALVFQLPLFLLAINQLHPLKLRQLFAAERWVILISTVVAAIITPTPDVFNLAMMALPPIALYQLAVVAIYLKNRRTKISNLKL